jgi:hypothetical protein
MADVDGILRGFFSESSTDVWRAAWAIIRLNRSEDLGLLAEKLPALKARMGSLEPERAIRDYRLDVRLALRVIETHRDGLCRCTLYAGSERFDPEREQDLGFVTVEGQRWHDWREHYSVLCGRCGTRWEAFREDGYHYPLWGWSREA